MDDGGQIDGCVCNGNGIRLFRTNSLIVRYANGNWNDTRFARSRIPTNDSKRVDMHITRFAYQRKIERAAFWIGRSHCICVESVDNRCRVWGRADCWRQIGSSNSNDVGLSRRCAACIHSLNHNISSANLTLGWYPTNCAS